jgi:tetratricopeptide (TPR) repeat protein
VSVGRRVARLLVVGAVAGWANVAAAGPSLWERARRPQAAKEAWLLGAMERTLDARGLALLEPEVARNIARGAVAMADVNGLHAPEDPRLACVLAQALIAADLGRERQAERLLEGALERLPQGPLRAEALRRLAYRLNGRRAHSLYTEALELESSSSVRGNLYYNRGDTNRELDHLDAARADYERALELAGEPDTQVLARYGLAVVLERLGDLPSAYAEFDAALVVTLPFPPYPASDPLELPWVTFEPAYERYYIEALRAMARLRHADSRAPHVVESTVALQAWDAYLASAPSTDPYRRNAEAHRRRVEEGTRQARKRPR